MSIHKFKLMFIPPIVLFIIIASSVLDLESSLPLMLLSSVLLTGSMWLEKRFPHILLLQFGLLGIFHYASQLNWCLLLYYIQITGVIQYNWRFKHMLPCAALITIQYTAIRLTYSPLTTYSLLVSVFDIISSLVIISTFHNIIRIETEKKTLAKQNNYLMNHDPLTGFLNYEGYMKRVQQLTLSRTAFRIVLLDINNFQSLNAKDMTSANDILVRFSVHIRRHFAEMLAAARYAGDRFAILIPAYSEVNGLDSFEDLGVQITYSVTTYPEEAGTFQEVISKAEDRIFQMRRETWLKSQEEFIRSAKMKTVGELAAGMAHEIRNPLTAIRGFVQLSKVQNYNIQPWYNVIMGEITRVGELTAEFLQFSKPHMSNMKLDSLSGCMSRVFSLCESEAASRGHAFTMEQVEGEVTVYMDRDKIIQVLINLIRNAFQAMENTGHVHLSLLTGDEPWALISVRDNGTGIPSEVLDRIFDPFFTTKEEGTGLGLSLCQKIVEDHGGYITVESTPGAGTTFTVKLPVSSRGGDGGHVSSEASNEY
ncbi:integral membrane sensor signal transduction histidine kinase [Paenibacillus algicola]|uniref:histidine kinase n=1 Tax=Paenibacillus algicola TaxID=2565926 RepID=A0A4P8XKV9_9BACL|nr:ATP-binding protein [Paenibacillus algicola]QCT02983.1 integral membrane sensor signal transduction histidine kinase [Paenibacillus algicola]